MNKETRKNRKANQTVYHILLIACGMAFALALMVLPRMSPILQVPEGNRLFRIAHAAGTQN